MADSERAQLLAERFDGVVCILKVKSFTYGAAGYGVRQHNGAEPRNGGDLFRAQGHFSKRVINNAVEALKVIAEPMASRPAICCRSPMVRLT